jgi:glycosyltransferase involved in cell wall biosynthesis
VVATDSPGLSDSVQDGVTGLLVRHARPAPLAAAITRLLRDDAERSRLGHNALAWSRNFRWEPAAAALERVIRRAAGQELNRGALVAPEGLKQAEVAA